MPTPPNCRCGRAWDGRVEIGHVQGSNTMGGDGLRLLKLSLPAMSAVALNFAVVRPADEIRLTQTRFTHCVLLCTSPSNQGQIEPGMRNWIGNHERDDTASQTTTPRGKSRRGLEVGPGGTITTSSSRSGFPVPRGEVCMAS